MENRPLPVSQQEILDSAVHPTGHWEEFPLTAAEATLAQRYGPIVERYGHKPAIIGAGGTITHAELNAQASQIGHFLSALQADNPGLVVALLVENDEKAIIGAWAALLAGVPYVVLEGGWPETYLRTILTTLSPHLLLTDAEHIPLAERIAPGGVAVYDWQRLPAMAAAAPLASQTTPETWASIQYTSGSTGGVKALVTIHRGILFAAASLINSMRITPEDRLLLAYPPGYSGHLSAVTGALCAGAALCLYDPKTSGIAPLGKWLTDSQVTIWTSTPALFREFVSTLRPTDRLSQIRFVRLHGDRTLRSDFDAYCRHFPDDCFFRNDLGMTELWRISQFIASKESRIDSPVVPVGYPYPGVEYWIETETGERARQGEEGYLVLRSPYLSPGYFVGKDRPLQPLTTEAQSGSSGTTTFRNGDRGVLDEAGCLHLLGRSNSEVKVRGYRVSLSLIERTLCTHSHVNNAIALVERHPTGEDELVAIVEVTAETDAALLRSQLMNHLYRHLPRHLLPDQVLLVDSLPVNSNGKVSAKGVLRHRAERQSTEQTLHPPRTQIEQIVADCWCTVLGRQAISIHDPFLELGGNSLQAMRIAARVQDEFGVEIPLAELFAAATVAEMALLVAAHLAKKMDLASIEESENV